MTRQETKLLTVLGTLLMIAVVAVLILVPYFRKLNFYEKNISASEQQIINLQRQVANKPELQAVLSEFEALLDESNLFMRVSDREAAAAQLLSSIKKIIEDAGGEISSINPARARNTDENSRTVSVRVSFVVDNDGFVTMLSELAGYKPLMNVVQTRMVPMIKRTRQGISETGQLRLSMDIEAFYSPETPETGA